VRPPHVTSSRARHLDVAAATRSTESLVTDNRQEVGMLGAILVIWALASIVASVALGRIAAIGRTPEDMIAPSVLSHLHDRPPFGRAA